MHNNNNNNNYVYDLRLHWPPAPVIVTGPLLVPIDRRVHSQPELEHHLLRQDDISPEASGDGDEDSSSGLSDYEGGFRCYRGPILG